MVLSHFDLEPESAHCVWWGPVLCFMCHLVLFPKPGIWGSYEGYKMSKMQSA